MPKGRGSNERRRSWRQKNPRDDKSTGKGMLILQELYGRVPKATAKQKEKRASRRNTTD
jgi:hypothetical protein